MKITSEMENFIKENYLYMSQKELANKLGKNITSGDIQYWLRKNNLYKRKYMFSDNDIQFMVNNYKTMSYKEIGKLLGFTEKQIKGKLNNMGYTKTRKFNKGYFHCIDSELKAYFIGFIFADGWIVINQNTRNYELGMELQEQDKYVLEKLNDELGGMHKIHHSNPYVHIINGIPTKTGHMYDLRIYSKDIVYDLYKHGIETNKTLKSTHPYISDAYFFDFLRGYIDGNGCYYNYKNNIYLHITCANESVLFWIKSVLDKYDIHTNIYKEHNKKFRLMCTRIKDMKILINFLYHKNFSFCLIRKYNKIKSYLIGSAT